MKTYGYIRISSTDQKETRQLAAMDNLKIPNENIFTDKQSGKDFDRPAYQALMKKLKTGDLLCVLSLDRLGRNYEEIQNQWRIITKKIGADISIIDMPLLDTRNGKDLMGTFIADVVLQILAFISENERYNIRQRQQEGIKAAKEQGIHFGRPFKKLPENFDELVKQYRCGELTIDEFAAQTSMKKSTIYRRLREIKNALS